MNTAIGYKLFSKDASGNLHPLFVGHSEVIPMGKWLEAKAGEVDEKTGKVKSSLGKLAYRGGWHLNDDAPHCTHIYSKRYSLTGAEIEPHTGKRFDRIQKENTVWCEVEYETTINQQQEANENGKNASGKIIPKNAQLRMVHPHGYYKYKTSPNMRGSWVICGNMKVNRELSFDEVTEICGKIGLEPLPIK